MRPLAKFQEAKFPITAESNPETWMGRGLCLKVGSPDDWFTETPSDATIAVCAACPVRAKCAEYAERENIPYGLFGGVVRHRPNMTHIPKATHCPGCERELVPAGDWQKMPREQRRSIWKTHAVKHGSTTCRNCYRQAKKKGQK